MHTECECRHDAEVATATSHRPEQVRLFLSGGSHQATVCGDDVHANEIVDGQPEPPTEPPHAAAEGQTTDTGMRYNPSRGHESVLQPGSIDITQQCATGNVGCSRLWINRDPFSSTTDPAQSRGHR